MPRVCLKKRTKKHVVRIPSDNIVGSLPSKKLLPKSDGMETKPRKVEEPYKEEATITGFSFVDKELLSTAFCADCGEFTLSEIHLDIKDCASSL